MSDPDKPLQAAEPGDLDKPIVDLWADYSKERFLATEGQIKEFRSWARQLGAAITVLIGLEMTIVVKVLFDLPEKFEGWHAVGLVFLLIALLDQIMVLRGNILTGYSGAPVLGPESPNTLRYILPTLPPKAAEEVFARYYANSYDNSHELQERLAKDIRRQARHLIISLLLFVSGVGALIKDVSSYQARHAGVQQIAPARTKPALEVKPSTHQP